MLRSLRQTTGIPAGVKPCFSHHRVSRRQRHTRKQRSMYFDTLTDKSSIICQTNPGPVSVALLSTLVVNGVERTLVFTSV